MDVFSVDGKVLAKENGDFRRVVFTGPNLQVVTMSIQPGDEIGVETHHSDQLFIVYDGEAEFTVGYQIWTSGKRALVVVPADVRHNVRNVGEDPLQLITVYAPPAHAAGTVQATNPDHRALAAPL